MQYLKASFIAVIIVFLTGASSQAITGLGFGIHGGLGNYRGDVFRYTIFEQTIESGDVGSSIQYGGHVKVGTLPVVDVYLNIDYFSKDEFYVFKYPPGDPTPDYTHTIDFRDLYISLDGKFNIYSLPASPVAFYMGGGIGSHLLNTELSENVSAGTEPPEDFEDTVQFFEDNGRFDIHGLFGVKVNPPVVPFEFFLEGRFALIKTQDEDKGRKDDLQAMSVLAGATFNLP
ncbi:MAG: hypothetical protein JSV84_16665 [Gemmatimonadota bacterium]|nr:MAG: hypothetical protein JSV84_16665 [Gemmatimonadota bacterium]